MPSLSHVLILAVAAASATGCGGSRTTEAGFRFCFDNCGVNSPPPAPPTRVPTIVGFPYDKVTPLGIGTLVPADVVTLHLLGTSDTVRTVVWSMSDTSIATLTAGTNGEGTVVAKAAGTFSVTANSVTYILACSPTFSCVQVTGLRVVAP